MVQHMRFIVMQITVYTIVKLTDGKKYARSKVFFTRKIIIFFRKIPQWEKKSPFKIFILPL